MDDEINLKDYLDVISRQWKLIVVICLITACAAFVISKMTKPVYEAKAILLIRSSSTSGFNQAAGLAAVAGMNLSSGGGVSDLLELVNSNAVARTVKTSITGSVSGGVEEKNIDLGKLTTKPSGNFLLLKVEHPDPVMAARIANAYVAALSEYWNRLNYTEARKKREYIEKQLPVVAGDLRKAEESMKKMTGIVSGNTEGSNSNSGGSASMGVEVERLKREIEIQNSVYIMLRNQYETVKLDEAKEISPFSDVDRAEVPLGPSGPKTKTNTAIGLLIGLIVGILVAFVKDHLDRAYK